MAVDTEVAICKTGYAQHRQSIQLPSRLRNARAHASTIGAIGFSRTPLQASALLPALKKARVSGIAWKLKSTSSIRIRRIGSKTAYTRRALLAQ
jgi:hypothetical protein